MKNTETIKLPGYGFELEVEFYYYPEEKPVYYDSNGTGYPGCGAEVEVTDIYMKGVNVTELVEALNGYEEIEDIILNLNF